MWSDLFCSLERMTSITRFIVALDRPIRQGQQRYPHLVWQLKKTEAEIMVKLTEEQITSKYGANCGLKPGCPVLCIN